MSSSQAERMWHYLVINSGIIVFCNWYRPGSTGLDVINSFEDELNEHVLISDNVFIAGDLNIHHKSWLQFSNGDTPEGDFLWSICQRHDLKQFVKHPTRENYLLDLCLSDFSSIKCVVCAPIADHNAVVCTLNIDAPGVSDHRREVWDFRRARWHELKDVLESISLTNYTMGPVQQCFERFMSMLDRNIRHCMPRTTITQQVHSHPWLSLDVISAFHAQQIAYGTEHFSRLQQIYFDKVREAKAKYYADLRTKLSRLPRNDRR